MGDIFLKILNMSIAASWLILAVVLLRFVLKKAPKWIAVLLWGLAALRLVVPFSFESALSLIPSAETFDAYNIRYETPAISSGIPAVNHAVNPVLGGTFAPNPAASVNPLYVWTFIASVIWSIGIAAMLLYAVISYVGVRRSVSERVPYGGNIFLCDHVKSPFILGLVRPKIYLPSGMDAMSLEPVIAHEKAHLARRDHWWKPLGFLILTVHWFNPLCWVAYVLLCRDIELACDEKVIRQMDLGGKKQYSTALLECSTGRRLVAICPLAFGEIGVKERVKNVLNYKKPALWIVSAAVIACVVIAVCFLTNPVTKEPDNAILEKYIALDSDVVSQENPPEIEELRVKYPEYFELGTFKGLDGVSTSSAGDADTPIAVEPDVAAATLSEEQTAIRQAIMAHNKSSNSREYDAACCSFIPLETLSGTPLAGSSTHKITCYGWALYEEYKVTEGGLETVSGSHIPVALSFDLDESGYTLTEYWEPRDGSYYAQDIREKFPPNIAEDGIDSQKFILQQKQECYAQAAASTGLDTDKVVGTLIETVCSSPALSSNPEDYIAEHSIEYWELTYYGRYTLKYCFARFEEGGETGLAGYVMMQACEDIAVGWGEEQLVFHLPMNRVLTGQMWYSAFKQNALSLMEQYTEIELAERYPASYLLLSMLGEV